MRMKSISSIVFITFFIETTIPISVQAEPPSNIFKNYSNLSEPDKKALDHAISICSDKENTQIIQRPDGYSSVVFYSKASEESKESPQVIDCSMVGIGPYKTKSIDIKDKNSCKAASVDSQFNAQKKTLEELHYQAQMNRCEKTGIQILSLKCAKELGCNISRSLINISTFGAASLIANAMKSYKSDNSCMNFKQDDCMTSVVKAVFGAMWDLLYEVPKALVKGAVKIIKKGWNWITSPWSKETEKQATSKMVMSSRTSDSQWSQFVHDPAGFIKDSLMNVMKTVMEKTQSVFKDAKLSWKCATCNGLINGICKLVGHLGAPIVISAVTGTIAGYMTKLFTSATEVKTISSIFKGMSEVAQALEKSRVVRFGKAVLETGGKVVKVVTEPIAKMISKIPGYGKFVALNEKAFMKGFLRDSEAYNVWSEEKKLSEVILKVEKNSGIGRKLTQEERAIVGEHPHFFEGKMTKEQTENMLMGLKSGSDSYENTLNSIRTMAGSNPEIAAEQAKSYAEMELNSAHAMANNPHLSPKQVKSIISAGESRAKGYLKAGGVSESKITEEIKDYTSILSKGEHAHENFEKYEHAMHKAHKFESMVVGGEGAHGGIDVEP